MTTPRAGGIFFATKSALIVAFSLGYDRCSLSEMNRQSRLSIGRYLPIETVFHKLDARTKILCIFAVVVSLFLSPAWYSWVIALIGIGSVSAATGIPISYLADNLRPLFPILFLTFILNAWMTPGDRLSTDIPFTDAGMSRGGILCLRLIVIVTVTSLLSLTTTPLELADGIQSLLSPLNRVRVPVHELALTATIALRLIPLLIDEAFRIRNAQLSRGASTTGSWKVRIRDAASILIPLFVSAFSRAERLAEAMEARGYRGSTGRTRYREPALGRPDLVAFLLSFAFCIGSLLLEID